MSRSGGVRDGNGLSILPYAVLLTLLLLNNLPGNISGLDRLNFGLFFGPLFFICLNSERDITPVVLLLFGLLNDLLTEAPLGFWAFLFVFFYGLSVSQRSLLQNATFTSICGTFSILLAITFLGGFLMAAIRDDMSVSGLSMFLSFLASLVAFPFVFGPLHIFGEQIARGETS